MPHQILPCQNTLASPQRRRWIGHLLGASVCWAKPAMGLAAEPEGTRRSPELLLARNWREGDDPAPYLVSEKFDGVRGYWDGERLRLRGGQEVMAPRSFLAALPAVPLDGELWLGRGRFDALSALVRRQSRSQSSIEADWATVGYKVFELPGGSGSFAQRYRQLQALLPAAAAARPGAQVVEQKAVNSAAELRHWLDQLVAQGGEGLVLHLADAPYLTGRQSVLAKFKPVEDAEAVVIGHLPGRGRLAGKLGALRVRNEAGQVFSVGSGLSEALREQPPALGSVITYAWRGETSSGLPRFASFVRVREEGL